MCHPFCASAVVVRNVVKASNSGCVEAVENCVLRGNDIAAGNSPAVYKKLMDATLKEGVATDASILLSSFKPEKDTNSISSPDARNSRSPQQLEVASELLDQLIATHETLEITLTYVCWELPRHPQIQQRLRSEIIAFDHGSCFAQSSRDGTTSGLPNAKAIDALPALHSVLMETLRLHPAVPGVRVQCANAPTCLSIEGVVAVCFILLYSSSDKQYNGGMDGA